MSVVAPAVALALPLLNAFPALSPLELHPEPMTISGVACASPADVRGLYRVNAANKVKSADELIALGSAAGYACHVLNKQQVLNGGQVPGPDGTIQVAGGTAVPIFELIENDNGTDHYYYVVAKRQ